MGQSYTLIRSDRKTVAIEIRPDATVVVRAPRRLAKRDIDAFVTSRQAWIEGHLERQRARVQARPEPTAEEAQELVRAAQAHLPGRVVHYAAQMGCRPTSIRVTGARTRYGSCSGKNAICFSYLLMRFPPEAIDYVVVHELAHIHHKNHGPAFYRCIESVLPDYKARRALLKQ